MSILTFSLIVGFILAMICLAGCLRYNIYFLVGEVKRREYDGVKHIIVLTFLLFALFSFLTGLLLVTYIDFDISSHKLDNTLEISSIKYEKGNFYVEAINNKKFTYTDAECAVYDKDINKNIIVGYSDKCNVLGITFNSGWVSSGKLYLSEEIYNDIYKVREYTLNNNGGTEQ